MSSRIEPTIRSRPVYGTLSSVPAAARLFVADADGAGAILDLAESLPDGWAATSEILYVPGGDGGDARDDGSNGDGGDHRSDALRALGSPRFHLSPTIEALLPRLKRTFERMRMGTQVHLAGSEPLIGQAMRVGMEAGIDHRAMQTEHRGTLARRVQCVHCKGVTENVTTQPVTCAHCGLLLLVRDHYSRRLAAFQGVNINAEDPSEIPPTETAFP